MKKFIYILLGSVSVIIFYFILVNIFPKSAGRYPVYVLLFLLDLYLYSSLHRKIWSWKKPKAIVITFLYWLPALMVLVLIFGSILIPFIYWNKYFETYIVGLILISYISKLIPMIFLFISDVIRFIRFLCRQAQRKKKIQGEKISRSIFLKRVGLIGGGLMFGGLLAGMIKWVHDFRVWEEIIRIPDLPPSFSGFRIVQFSDLHLGSWLSKKDLEEAVDIINDLDADVAFFTGDMVNYSSEETFKFEHILNKIKTRMGVYTILGNHDYGDYVKWKTPEAKTKNLQELYNFYRRILLKLLSNENVIIKKGDDKIVIIGVENWGSMKRFQKFGDIDKAIKGAEDVPVKILLSHDPTFWEYKVNNFRQTIDLTLSGHTHGGQVGVEFPAIKWSTAQYIYKYWAGLYSSKNMTTGGEQYLYVNRGTGSIGYPGRVGILPEITLIELY